MSDAPILDVETLEVLTEAIGDEAVRAIIGIFLGECRDLAAVIGAAATPQAASRAAHSLKSSAGQLGAFALAEAALAVETAANSNSPELPGLVVVLVDCARRSETVLAARLTA
jgi:HPt (histidine-containing phosphotransfer) domain-containing protein